MVYPLHLFLTHLYNVARKGIGLKPSQQAHFTPAEEYSIKLLYCIVLVLIRQGDVKVALRCFSSLLQRVVANVANVAGVLV
jgi:hypothetical protein